MGTELRVPLTIAMGGVLLTACTARAGFVGIGTLAEHVTIETGGFGEATAWSVYALVDNPLDRMHAVFGNQQNPLSIVTTGTFFQHPFGYNNEPQAELLPLYPELAYDTYVTINSTSQSSTGSGTMLGSTFGSFGPSSLVLEDSHWLVHFDQPPAAAVEVPGLGLGVLIGHFTTESSATISGTVNLIVNQMDYVYQESFQATPAPGALPLLGLAALITRRRRR